MTCERELVWNPNRTLLMSRTIRIVKRMFCYTRWISYDCRKPRWTTFDHNLCSLLALLFTLMYLQMIIVCLHNINVMQYWCWIIFCPPARPGVCQSEVWHYAQTSQDQGTLKPPQAYSDSARRFRPALDFINLVQLLRRLWPKAKEGDGPFDTLFNYMSVHKIMKRCWMHVIGRHHFAWRAFLPPRDDHLESD